MMLQSPRRYVIEGDTGEMLPPKYWITRQRKHVTTALIRIVDSSYPKWNTVLVLTATKERAHHWRDRIQNTPSRWIITNGVPLEGGSGGDYDLIILDSHVQTDHVMFRLSPLLSTAKDVILRVHPSSVSYTALFRTTTPHGIINLS